VELSSAERRRLGIIGPTSRRRRRSDSDHEDDQRLEGSDYARDHARRTKRRRFDSPPPIKKPTPIKYGYYGQVESGRLKLELVSCDGGEHRDPRNTIISLGPENILRYDKSVYCSEQRSSTIVVRHADDTPFSLEKLHILAPEHGFTAPVRAGVVHVAMTMADLQKYINPPSSTRRARVYSPPYVPPPRRGNSIQASPERLTLADALRDPEVNAALGDSEQNYGRSADGVHDLAGNTDYPNGRTNVEPHCDLPSPTTSPVLSRPQTLDRNPVALLFDEEAGPEDHSTQEVLDFRLQRLRHMRRRLEMENWDREDRYSGIPPHLRNDDRSLSRVEAMMARSRVDDDASLTADIENSGLPSEAEIWERAQRICPERDDPDVTTARFFISRGKTQVTIKFDPPVSGRFVAMRCWSGKSNVDVQAVIAKGFGGPRFFPAKEVRVKENERVRW